MADHTPSLFKGNPKLRDEFEKKYNQLLSSSLPPIVDAASTVDGWFEDQWQELLVMAKQGLACPDELQEDGDVVQMELTQTFEAELRDITELEDEEEMEMNHDDRVLDSKQKKKQRGCWRGSGCTQTDAVGALLQVRPHDVPHLLDATH